MKRIRHRLARKYQLARKAWRMKHRPTFIRHRGIKLPMCEPLSDGMREILYGGNYENSEYMIIRERLERDDRVLELGSGLGVITTLCARIAGSDSVYTYEANPTMIPYLEKVFDLNGVAPHLENKLVANGVGDVELNTSDFCWSSSVHSREKCQGRVSCPAVPFEAVVDKIKPSVLVVDVEGGEYCFLQSAIAPCVRKLLIEFHVSIIGEDKTWEVRDWIEEQGFVFIRQGEDDAVGYYERR